MIPWSSIWESICSNFIKYRLICHQFFSLSFCSFHLADSSIAKSIARFIFAFIQILFESSCLMYEIRRSSSCLFLFSICETITVSCSSVGFNVCVLHWSSSISSLIVGLGIWVLILFVSFISSNLFLQFEESLHRVFLSSKELENEFEISSIHVFNFFFWGEGNEMFVDSVWIIVISRSFISLFHLVDFSMYPSNIFVMFLRIQIFPVFQRIVFFDPW